MRGSPVRLETPASAKPRKKHPVRRFFVKAILVVFLLCLVFPPYAVPMKGPVTSGFLFRPAPDQLILPDMEIHGGIDIAAPQGTPVFASKSGRVVTTGTDRVAGNFVVLGHWFGFSTRYQHLQSITVKQGAYALKGTKIGTAGSTGRATGPHLHFEVSWAGHRLPPGLFLSFGSLRAALLSRIFG